MTKLAEQSYLSKLSELGRWHAMHKPFSDPSVGIYLVAMGVIFTLLPRPPGRLLDLGCGTGWTSAFFARAGYAVTGQDIAPDMIQAACEMHDTRALPNLGFVCNDYESMTFENEFDCAVFFDSLHHCDDEAAALAAVYRALKPGGVLVTHEPGAGHSRHPDSVRAREQFGVNERDMPPNLILAAARRAGFTGFDIYPLPSTAMQQLYVPSRRLNGGFGARALAAILSLRSVLIWQHERGTRSAIMVLRKPA